MDRVSRQLPPQKPVSPSLTSVRKDEGSAVHMSQGSHSEGRTGQPGDSAPWTGGSEGGISPNR